MAKVRSGLPVAVLSKGPKRRASVGGRRKSRRWRGWKLYALLAVAVPFVLLAGVTAYYYVTFSRMIDARLHGEFDRADPRVFARPFEVRKGQSLSPRLLVDRLNDLGYAQRARAEAPGEFTLGRDTIHVVPPDGDSK